MLYCKYVVPMPKQINTAAWPGKGNSVQDTVRAIKAKSRMYDIMSHTNRYMSPDNVQNKYPRQTYLAAINVFIEHLSAKGLSADVPHLQSHMSITYTRSKESRGFAKKKIPKIRVYYGSGWVGPGLTRNFFSFGKPSQKNSSKPVLIFWSRVVYHVYSTIVTLIKGVSYYDLSGFPCQ